MREQGTKNSPTENKSEPERCPQKMKLIQQAEKTLGTWQLRKKSTDENETHKTKSLGKRTM